MDLREITAEKIRAMNDRVRYRDFYDFVMIRKKMDVNINEAIDLVKQKEIRKTISRKNILENWRLARQEKQQEFFNIFYSEEARDDEIEAELKKFSFIEIKR